MSSPQPLAILRSLAMKPSIPEVESLQEYAQRIKAADRLLLGQLDPTTAQAKVDAVLAVAHWTIADRSKLTWLGDLGDEAELPEWMNE